jgi:Hydrophobic surface binding protein A
MQLISLILPFALFASVLAHPQGSGGSAAYLITAIKNIWLKVMDLSEAVNELKPEATAADFAKIDALSAAIVSTINDGTKALKAGKVVSLMDAIGIQSSASNLANASQNSVDDLIAKKEILVKGGQKDNVVKQFNAIKTATLAFNKELHAKLPSAVQAIATTQEQQPLEAMDKGIKAFST